MSLCLCYVPIMSLGCVHTGDIESLSVMSQKLKVAKLRDMMRHSERASGKMPACQKSAFYFILGVRYEHFHGLMTPYKPF